MNKYKWIFLTIFLLFSLSIAAVASWFFQLNSEITEKLRSQKFLPPTEYYSSPLRWDLGQTLDKSTLTAAFKRRNYRERQTEQKIFPGDFTNLSLEQCRNQISSDFPDKTSSCTLFQAKAVESQNPSLEMILWDEHNQVLQMRGGNPLQITDFIELEPELIAQYIGNDPLMMTQTPLGGTPTLCLKAVLAIEDAQFLEHSGVSPLGILRAAYRNVFTSGVKQGGSTITQQLVKNYFLTSERTLKRKFVEFFMSLILESHSSKDEILETYLNILYLGQNGSFQIRGMGAASAYYFAKPLDQLELHECSMLAAMIASPGLFSPFQKPENALKRRGRVLQRMSDLKMISDSERDQAQQKPLPKTRDLNISETAPYYLNAAQKQIANLQLQGEGHKIFTGLSLVVQKASQEALQSSLDQLEAENKLLQKIKAQGQTLEGAVLTADHKTGWITSAVGGRNFRKTQFNRAVEAHRQIGSIMKPFVFLAALEKGQLGSENFHPLTLLQDEKFSYSFDRQVWSPENYGKKYFGQVPAYFALKNSLNAATAHVGLGVGLPQVVEVAHRAGLHSKIEALPSLILGAAEMTPVEVLEAYVTLARMGSHEDLSFVRKVTDLKLNPIYEFQTNPQTVFKPEDVASLVSMMEQTVLSGSAKALATLGFNRPAAGKTGTTSDYKDAWFAGFTPYRTTVVWIGYDNNVSHGLTGASGPVPVWAKIMKQITADDPSTEFNWPPNTEIRNIDETSPEGLKRSVPLVFKK